MTKTTFNHDSWVFRTVAPFGIEFCRIRPPKYRVSAMGVKSWAREFTDRESASSSPHSPTPLHALVSPDSNPSLKISVDSYATLMEPSAGNG